MARELAWSVRGIAVGCGGGAVDGRSGEVGLTRAAIRHMQE